jgi:ketose-bisphosphate aldolase
MPLANPLPSLLEARAAHAAICGFEPYNLEQIQAILEAAEEEGVPVILQFWSEVIETWGFPAICALVRELAARCRVPVAMHLDHALDEELIDHALAHGFQSVMFDGSRLPYEENIERTRAVVRKAREFGACVEAELGLIGFLQDYATTEEALEAIAGMLTTPDQARDFVRATGIDILAPAIGSIHGCPLPVARLDIPRIEAISSATNVPLALHGGSGVPEDQVRAAIRAGVAKINVDAEVRAVTIRAMQEGVAKIGSGEKVYVDLARYPRGVRAATKEAVRARLRMSRA